MKVTEINIYPIKSTRRIALQESEVLPRGLPWDRRWMLVDAKGRFITARDYPSLAMVQTALKGGVLQVRVAGADILELALQPPDGEVTCVTVWRDQCHAFPAGAQADAWFPLTWACHVVWCR
jgi:uncharacterized protein YcbX